MYKQRRPTMNDLDVQLIREFAMRPIIYNKSTPFFKNKYLTDCAWDEISAKVGGDGESFYFNRFFIVFVVVIVVLIYELAKFTVHNVLHHGFFLLFFFK